MSEMDHLIAVEVIGIFPIVSVTGYRDEEELQYDAAGTPLFDGVGQPIVTTIRVENTEDISAPGTAYLDPAKTNIRALVKAGLVRVVAKKPAEPFAEPAKTTAAKKVKEG